jgi:hypothetical protein
MVSPPPTKQCLHSCGMICGCQCSVRYDWCVIDQYGTIGASLICGCQAAGERAMHKSHAIRSHTCWTLTPIPSEIQITLLEHNPMTSTPSTVPSVFERNLQCQPVRGVDTREECHWSHACSIQANMRGVQWHPRVQIICLKTRTVPSMQSKGLCW